LEDIPQLTAHFSKSLASELGVEPPQLSQADLACLRNYDWPGNVRELKNVIERCLLLNSSPSQCLSKPSLSDDPADSKSEGDALQLDQVEKHHILRVLEGEGGNKSAAARLLGISRKTLERKVQAWGEC
jgi:two-component system NtrC family response regulator